MAKKLKKLGTEIPVRDLKHLETRTNLPTQQLAEYMSPDEREPRPLIWPRDPSLDPQLVWTGKDQNAESLSTYSVPLYVQERIAPEALIRSLHSFAEQDTDSEAQLDLFGYSNDIVLEKKIEFYKHAEGWTNRLILGDSLLVMTSLADREGLKGAVQTIYIDPPYGIRYGSNWQVSTRNRDVSDGKKDSRTSQPEQVRAYRDTWELGIHSYLSYLRDRIAVSRQLLNETGSIFVQIGDQNVHLVRSLLDEVFGATNFVSQISFRTTGGLPGALLNRTGDLILWYAKDIARVKYRPLYQDKGIGARAAEAYTMVEEADGTRRAMRAGEEILDGMKVFRADQLASQGATAGGSYGVEIDGTTYTPPRNNHWKTTEAGMLRLRHANRLLAGTKSLSYLRYLNDFPVTPVTNNWDDTGTSGYGDPKLYVVQTNLKVIGRCILMTTDPGDLVLDPTLGSGTTAVAAEHWGRRWIGIDTSRVAMSIARTRLMGSKYPAFLLTDSAEGQRKEQELTAKPATMTDFTNDVRRGFVLERVPHIMLSDIANNPAIKAGMSRSEIERTIAQGATKEFLSDRPYEADKVTRVSGPFTVESLSPHRQLADEENESHNALAESGADAAAFAESIRENLKAAGLRYPRRDVTVSFDSVDAQPGGVMIHAVAQPRNLPDVRLAAISIGPRFGTVTRSMVLEASKEGMSLGADLLIVCGFAFESDAQDIPNLGRLEVVCARMNSDLLVEELKATRSGQLFTVFGEPDVTVHITDDQMVQVEVLGVDVFDPTSGEVRSHSTDDISAWFLDTDYNSETFFVRHAYFLGQDDPYDKLRRALKKDIDSDVWDSVNSPRSRSFPKPRSGKIAIKVINHFGDEVMKVYSIS